MAFKKTCTFILAALLLSACIALLVHHMYPRSFDSFLSPYRSVQVTGCTVASPDIIQTTLTQPQLNTFLTLLSGTTYRFYGWANAAMHGSLYHVFLYTEDHTLIRSMILSDAGLLYLDNMVFRADSPFSMESVLSLR